MSRELETPTTFPTEEARSLEIPDWDEYTASLPWKVMLSPVDPTKGIVEAWSWIEQEVVRALCSDREVGDHIVVGPAGFCSREGAGNGIYVACSGEPEAAKRILEAYKDRLPRDADIIVDKGFLQDVASQMPLASVQRNAPERPSTTLHPMNANYQMLADMGASIGTVGAASSGTLGCYVVDPEGSWFGITNCHVLEPSEVSKEPLPRTLNPGGEISSPSGQDHGIVLAQLITEKKKAQEKKGLKAAVLQAEQMVKEYKKKDRMFGSVLKGFRGVVDGAWVDVAIMAVKNERRGDNFITYNDQSLAVTGWEEPSAGTLVLKIGRSTKDTYGTILGQFSRICKLRDDSNAKKSVLVTKEWAITSDPKVSRLPGLHFMDRGDSGSAIVRRPNSSEQKVPAVGLLVAGALQKLSGVYLAPACDATVPAFKFQEYELKHTPPETEEVLGG
ncbi:hypothetical protein FN846DRAFT_914255 [Sphaerosporella brunnea]|uniref:Uncharacterized protein n=1 Tax=Sphaerosporella brunnea TaxID=1250544 RepID=A0A5J5ED30_9PEZI|nr:hypothetical protein FN846DRAFT_914255 [Sphaerosporella brunnea]